MPYKYPMRSDVLRTAYLITYVIKYPGTGYPRAERLETGLGYPNLSRQG